ncbi:MAG: alpha/beta hydrolase [Nannocystaceae bacterium]
MLELVAPWLFLFVAAAGAVFTLNAFVPIRRSKWLVVPSFLLSLLAAELAAYHLLWQGVATLGFVAFGGLSSWPGYVAVTLVVASWLGLLVLVVQGQRSIVTVRKTLAELGLQPRHRIRWTRVLLPFPLRLSKSRVERNVEFARVRGHVLRLDVYRPPPGTEGPRPAVVQVHGGGWVVGDKREQGVPLMTRLSDRGFVGFNVNYRLSPGATWPDHLIDVKRAIAWIREHADEYDVDPDFIAISGGSAGGHITAMVALTESDPAYQPGFEQADTRVAAAIPFYGIYDLTDRLHTHAPGFLDTLLEPLVIKEFFDEHPEAFSRASPIDNVHPGVPPFFVIHGDRDSMAPLQDARAFVEGLRECSEQPVLYAELAGAQHAFDLFVSPRSLPVIEGVGDFLEHLVELRRAGQNVPPRAEVAAEARA